jgi:hypothetical protein
LEKGAAQIANAQREQLLTHADVVLPFGCRGKGDERLALTQGSGEKKQERKEFRTGKLLGDGYGLDEAQQGDRRGRWEGCLDVVPSEEKS